MQIMVTKLLYGFIFSVLVLFLQMVQLLPCSKLQLLLV